MFCVFDIGKVLADYNTKIGDEYFGGYTPTLEAIIVDVDECRVFALYLFRKHNAIEDEKKYIYTAVLIHRYDDICEVIQQHPENLFENLNDHIFVAKVRRALQICNISEETFEQWKKDIKKDFCSKNLLALDIKSLQGVLGSDIRERIYVDPRCLLQTINETAHHMGVIEKKIHELRDENILINQVWQQRFKIIQDYMIQQGMGAESPPRKVETYLKLDQIFITRRSYSLQLIFVNWFEYQAEVGWLMYYEDATRSQKVKYNKMKKGIRTMVMFTDVYPVSLCYIQIYHNNMLLQILTTCCYVL